MPALDQALKGVVGNADIEIDINKSRSIQQGVWGQGGPGTLLGDLWEGTPSLVLPRRRQELGRRLMPKNKVRQE